MVQIHEMKNLVFIRTISLLTFVCKKVPQENVVAERVLQATNDLQANSPDRSHDFDLAKRDPESGALRYFRIREGVKMTPEETFASHVDDIGLAGLDLRRMEEFDYSWEPRRQGQYD